LLLLGNTFTVERQSKHYLQNRIGLHFLSTKLQNGHIYLEWVAPSFRAADDYVAVAVVVDHYYGLGRYCWNERT
jgi:hypothetical protein